MEHGAGRSAERIDPGGQITRSGAKEPWFAPPSAFVSALNATCAEESRPVEVLFTGPATCGCEPVKSQMNSSSVMVTLTRTSNGPLPRPSSST